MGELVWIFTSACLINNFTLSYFLGLCPFMGVSARIATALRMGLANIFVLLITSICAWILNTFVLARAPYLRLIAFIVVIASLVQIVEMVIEKFSPDLYNSLGVFLPLIAVNCAILGAALFMVQRDLGFIDSVAYGLGAGVGWALAIIMLAGLREKMKYSDIPDGLEGLGIAFVTTGLISLAFMGIAGLSF